MPTVIDGITGINRITGGADVGGNLDFVATGARITGDFSNATQANRTMLQTSVANGETTVGLIPNGTALVSSVAAFNSSGPDNASFLNVGIKGTNAFIDAGKTGSGVFLPMTFSTGDAERMRIAVDGQISCGSASPNGGRLNVVYDRSILHGIVIRPSADSGPGVAVLFMNAAAGGAGSISTTAVATAYNTSSDYRLKENIRAMVAPLERLLRLKPVLFNWKIDGSEGEGFIAHQLQKEVPMAVTGEKDGEQMQGVDASKVVPLLVAAVQELAKEVAELKARLA